jgi:hypothetical protein
VQEAIDNPGVAEIPERQLNPGGLQVTEIPQRMLEDADDGGVPVPIDPALLVVPISRPTEFSWLRLHPERTLMTPLLAYKTTPDASPEYHYVVPELETMVRQYLKQVAVHLIWDAGGAGSAYLWILPANSYSPYFATMQRALAMGAQFVASHYFNIGKANVKQKSCPLKHRLPRPDDPTVLLPSRPVSQLLAEALGDRIIASTAHPIYQSLAAGSAL